MAMRTTPFYPIQGMEEVLQNLARLANKIKGGCLAGLVQAGFLVLRESKKLCPVDLGNLRASGYVMWTKKQFDMTATNRAFITTKKGEIKSKFVDGPAKARLEMEYDQVLEDAKANVEIALSSWPYDLAVEVGFTAYYAIYVHEDLTASHPSKKNIGKMSVEEFEKRLKINEAGELVFEGGPGEAKFLIKALEQNQAKILLIIQKKAMIK